MANPAALDASGLRLVRKGLAVVKDGRQGLVTKANGRVCYVQWPDSGYAVCELSTEVTVISGFPTNGSACNTNSN
jgi:hypothetical protein